MSTKTITTSLLRPYVTPIPASCLLCQWRTFSTTHHRLAEPASEKTDKKPSKTPIQNYKAAAPKVRPLEFAPRAYGQRVREFTPTVLPRPIGLDRPPKATDNTGFDARSLKQRRDDFVDYDKHLKRREELKSQMSRPYFRDWSNLNLHKGKTFIAPPRPFKHDKSLYFPNFYGGTLQHPSKPSSTTPVLQGKASVVAIFSTGWAERQVMSFIAEDKNREMHKILEEYKGQAQLVRINIEDQSWLRYWFLRLCAPLIRRNFKKENWTKYFLVKSGITDELREGIGALNSKVGYVYLVDGDCKLRWAGSGPAQPEELQSLAKSLARLIDEKKNNVWSGEMLR
ncbi:ATP10 protein-domain-containing protein [Coniella lustricola]|uniref:ATP10 protein-domain-containing protein n=1 Tax=Coniella lustricola TaxID=2025994 RepID=A0A2T3ABI2_9PEZI|nr:ATP10 protein-domain-containing protein [Coniella lustricola]